MRQFIYSMEILAHKTNISADVSHDSNILKWHSLDSIDLLFDQLSFGRINYINLGLQNYMDSWEFQKKIHEKNKNFEFPDVVLFLEHSHVYTFGKNADKDFLLDSHPDADIIQTDRGGQVTYHGPGQLIGYPIINLNNYKKSVTWFMRSLEDIIIGTLRTLQIASSRKEGLPGVWIQDDKICAMGVRIAKWVTMHGFAFNVNTDLSYFGDIVPCGIINKSVTSMQKELGMRIDIEEVKTKVKNNLISLFEMLFFEVAMT